MPERAMRSAMQSVALQCVQVLHALKLQPQAMREIVHFGSET